MQRQHKHTSITIQELLGHVFSMRFLCGPCRAYLEEIRKQIRETVSQCESSTSRKTSLKAVVDKTRDGRLTRAVAQCVNKRCEARSDNSEL
jgi:hypothetical protein